MRNCCARWALWLAPRALAAIIVLTIIAPAAAEEIAVRLRFAWGSGPQSPQKWYGRIVAKGAALSDLQPLGIEADEVAAVRLADNQVLISPLVRRVFDGCDVTVRGDENTPVSVQLRNSTAAEAKEVEVTLGQLAAENFRAPLDELGAYLLVHRAPGDQLRVGIKRDHLVFDPKEAIRLVVEPALAVRPDGPVRLEATLRRATGGDVLWEQTQPINTGGDQSLTVELEAPAKEGAYALHLAVHRPAGFADKFVPWDHAAPLASRTVEFVVIDPAARLPRLTDKWEVVETIDAANARWWQRFPQWTPVGRLPGLTAPRPIGNVKPTVGGDVPEGFVELPAPRLGQDAPWQSYSLSIAEVNRPHAVEIELPPGSRQHLGVSIVEPDAAGRVQSFGRDASVYGDDRFTSPSADKTAPIVHRMVFWPRTTSPVLLLSNRSTAAPVRYGKIRILRRETESAPSSGAVAGTKAPQPERLVAAYIGSPRFADALGAAENFDETNKLSVDGWSTFLTAATRLAQQLEAAGFNAAIVSIAADGSSLAPIDALGASPRYDTGPLSAAAPDPRRKDVLEALLRVFDREGLLLIPAVELATPLPRLEAQRGRAKPDSKPSPIDCVARDGGTWSQHFAGETAVAPHYNILNAEVQQAVAEVVAQLAERYGRHPALAGVALQLSGRGYGVLPGAAWAMDEATLSRFLADAKVEPPADAAGDQRRVAAFVLGSHLDRWKTWRRDELTRFYASVAERARRRRDDLRLVLCTEELFAGPEAAQRLRQSSLGHATVEDAASEIGVDLRELAATPGVALLRPRLVGFDESLDDRARDIQINTAVEIDAALAECPRCGELIYHAASKLRLPSFDAQSPFGADRTYLSLSSPSAPAGETARRPMASALAGRDILLMAEGTELTSLAETEAVVRARRLLQQLPGGDADVRTDRRQPVMLRIYRHGDATTLCLVNESPWPVDVELPLEATAPTVWRALGQRTIDDATAPSSDAGGAWAAGAQTWTVELPPYGIEARRFETRSLRVGAFTTKLGDAPAAALAARIDEIRRRMQNLDVERPYNELQNPDFELVSGDAGAHGWQPRVGRTGAVEVDATTAASGVRSLHLRSNDDLGVAAQSHRFPIPATGQLAIRVSARGQGLAPGAQLYAWVEYDDHGVQRRRCEAIAGADSLGDEWSTCEYAIGDLPLGDGGQMRIHFHLAGRGAAWIDDVRLFDLRFANAQRVELGKLLYAAGTALDQGEYVDCQRLVEGYWPRYLLEYVPPALEPPREVSVADRPSSPAAKPDDAAKGDGGEPAQRRRWGIPLLRR